MRGESAFKPPPNGKGNYYQQKLMGGYQLQPTEQCQFDFIIQDHEVGEWVGVGGWFSLRGDVLVSMKGCPGSNKVRVFPGPCWSKFGSMWKALSKDLVEISLTFTAQTLAEFSVYGLGAGVVHHQHLKSCRLMLLENMSSVSPEAHFFVPDRAVQPLEPVAVADAKKPFPLVLKACRRCLRYLPINVGGEDGRNERLHLSFNNHCTAKHLLPCRHNGFSILKGLQGEPLIHLEHGYQDSCRFCVRFEVNGQLNAQKTPAQKKEDSCRRRYLEVLLEDLYQGSPHLNYRQETGRELADDIFKRFEGHCFNCNEQVRDSFESWALDHTRPLALLWPLDGTATLLCKSCNSRKRDHPPGEFYSENQLVVLAQLTGIDLEGLRNPGPNLEAIDRLAVNLGWFHSRFLKTPEMTKEYDGKTVAGLLCKSLEKIIGACPEDRRFDLYSGYGGASVEQRLRSLREQAKERYGVFDVVFDALEMEESFQVDADQVAKTQYDDRVISKTQATKTSKAAKEREAAQDAEAAHGAFDALFGSE